MAACPVLSPLPRSARRPLLLTPRRLAANRRNAARSTGPRSADGKARVARNAIKHGFFTAQERWSPSQQHDFATTLDGLRDDFRPCSTFEEGCVRTLAAFYVRMAAVLRYENIAALKHHQRRDRELDARIAAADPPEAARLRALRNRLRRGGLWRPTIPDEPEASAILRYLGRLDRTIHAVASHLQMLKSQRKRGAFHASGSSREAQKQTHYSAAPNSGPEALRRAYAQRFDFPASPNSDPEEAEKMDFHERKRAKTNPLRGGGLKRPEALPTASDAEFAEDENAKTNPLSSMFTGNRHERRRAKALARRTPGAGASGRLTGRGRAPESPRPDPPSQP